MELAAIYLFIYLFFNPESQMARTRGFKQGRKIT
jgi:hypothetical protein